MNPLRKLRRHSLVIDGRHVNVHELSVLRPTDAEQPDLPTFVLVHGLGVSSRYFVPLAELLSRHGRVVVFDLPGFGLAALRENPGFLRFLWNSNFNVILRQSANRFDVLVLGAMMSPAAVGVYQLGKRVMNRLTKLAGPLRQTIYPELARLWDKGKIHQFNRLVLIFSASILLLQLVRQALLKDDLA